MGREEALIAGFVGGIVGAAAIALMRRKRPAITRIGTSDPRSSVILVRDGVVTISGQVCVIDNAASSDITAQTQQTLAKIDDLLAQAGSCKSQILEARCWLKHISRDFAPFNAVWNAWVDQESKGCRYCVEANLAREALLVEVQVVAAIK